MKLKMKKRSVGSHHWSQSVLYSQTARTGQIQLAMQQEMESGGAFASKTSDGMAPL